MKLPVLFEDVSVPEQKKRVAVLVGRFNPPTRGHYHALDSAKAFIRQHPELQLEAAPVVVIVDGAKTGKDKQRNPLTAHERQLFMEGSGRANGVKFLTAKNALSAFIEVRKAGMEPIAIVAGSDRAADYMRLLGSNFKRKNGEAIEHIKVPGLERDNDEMEEGSEALDELVRALEEGEKVPVGLISGTLARHAARAGKKRAFAYTVGLERKLDLAEFMLKKIKQRGDDHGAV